MIFFNLFNSFINFQVFIKQTLVKKLIIFLFVYLNNVLNYSKIKV